MVIKRRWMTLETPSKIIKEDEYTYNWPEDLEELIDPDGDYKVLITSYYHECDAVVYFVSRRRKNE